jgi:hypothetical protein
VSARLVIIDYPSARSVALLQAIWRRLLHRFGARTGVGGCWATAVARVLKDAGFRVDSAHRQFVLPIAVHKAIGSRRFSERTRARLGTTRTLARFGSPVTIVAQRWYSRHRRDGFTGGQLARRSRRAATTCARWWRSPGSAGH